MYRIYSIPKRKVKFGRCRIFWSVWHLTDVFRCFTTLCLPCKRDVTSKEYTDPPLKMVRCHNTRLPDQFKEGRQINKILSYSFRLLAIFIGWFDGITYMHLLMRILPDEPEICTYRQSRQTMLLGCSVRRVSAFGHLYLQCWVSLSLFSNTEDDEIGNRLGRPNVSPSLWKSHNKGKSLNKFMHIIISNNHPPLIMAISLNKCERSQRVRVVFVMRFLLWSTLVMNL